MQGIAEKIRDLRSSHNYTQNDLAQISGVSRHTISDIESDSCDPQVSTLTAVLAALGMEIRIGPIPMKPARASSSEFDIKAYIYERYPVKEDGWNGTI